MLLRRMLRLPPESFLISQAMTLCVLIKIQLGKLEAAHALWRQLLVHRARYASDFGWAVAFANRAFYDGRRKAEKFSSEN